MLLLITGMLQRWQNVQFPSGSETTYCEFGFDLQMQCADRGSRNLQPRDEPLSHRTDVQHYE